MVLRPYVTFLACLGLFAGCGDGSTGTTAPRAPSDAATGIATADADTADANAAADALAAAGDAATAPDAGAELPDGASTGEDAGPPTPLANSVPGCDPSDGVTWDSTTRLEAGPWFVGTQELVLTDPTRETPANGLVPSVGWRTLPTTVWYPAKKGPLGDATPSLGAPLAREDGPFPLVVHCHGFMSERGETRYLAEHLASHGYVVVAADFPLSNLGAAGGPTVMDVVNQPGDVSFLIDQMLARSLSAGDALYGAATAERVAVTGTSLGGLTTSLVTWHPDLRDERVRAAATFAGPSYFLTDAFYRHADVPLLLVHGSIDAIIAYDANAVWALSQTGSLAALVTLEGGSHTGFAQAAELFAGLDNPDQVGCEALVPNLPKEDGFLTAFDDPGSGVVIPDEQPPICAVSPLPPALSAARQHALTNLAARAFLDLALTSDAGVRASACRFLRESLGAQNDDMRVTLPSSH